jgi:hypothetical protein
MGAKAASVPSPSPPRAVGFIVFEFTRQKHSDENLMYRPLDGDYRYETKYRVGCVPEFQEPLKPRC